MAAMLWAWIFVVCTAWARPVCPKADHDAPPRWEQRDCPFKTSDLADDVTCGVLVLASPRGRGRACGIEIGALRLGATGSEHGPPILLLPGGPGQVLVHQGRELAEFTRPWRAQRALWTLDPRFSGALAWPHLHGDVLPKRVREAKYGSLEEYFGAAAPAYRRMGVAIDSVTTRTLASDAAALLEATGVERAHVVAASYGTRWAQALVRDHPDRVASLLLDAPAPLDARLFDAVNTRMDEALERWLADCATTPKCAAVVPDPSGTVARIVAAADAEPITVRHGERERVLDGAAIKNVILEFMSGTNRLPQLAHLLAAMASGETARWSGFAFLRTDAGVAPPIHHLVQCADEVPAYTSTNSDNPALHYQRGVCAALGRPPSQASDRAAVTSTIPTRVVVGRYDPKVPVEWAETLAGRFGTGAWVDAAGAHGLLRWPCGADVVTGWLDDRSSEVPACLAGRTLAVEPLIAP